MEITAKMVKELRQATNAGMMNCKMALQECDGDMEKAIEFLRRKGIASAAKREGRQTSQGVVDSYIHPGGRVGVLVEIACETDFVARTEDFLAMVHNIALHIAATNPIALRREDVDPSLLNKEREIYKSQMLEQGKPENIIDKIVEGKIDKFISEICLLEQTYIKDPEMTVADYLNSGIGKFGENMNINRFARFEIGA